MHAMKQGAIVRLGEINLPLPALDVLEPDLVLQVDAKDGRRGDHGLAEPSVEQLRSLSMGQVSGFLQSRWCN